MQMMRRAKLLLYFSLIASLVSSPAMAAVKAGSTCSKLNATSIVASFKYTCIKSGKKLVWSRGTLQSIPSPTPSATPTSEPANYKPNSSNIQTCQLQQKRTNYFGTGFGFPRSPYRLKNTGEVNGLFLYVEFNDVKGNDDPEKDAATYVPKFIKYYKAVSYGQLTFKVDVYPKYLPISKDSSSYGMNVWTGGNPWQYWKDGLTAAAPYVNFGKYDFVVVIPPSGIKEIIYGPSMPLPPTDKTGYTAQKYIYNGLMGGADQRNNATRWIWLAHEIGHDLGMEHQYSFDGQAVWDLMNNVYDFTAPELLGWHRFLQGWMTPEKIACLEKSVINSTPLTIRLKPLSGSGPGTHLVIIKYTTQTALVVEYRTITEFDTLDGDKNLEGIIVYQVDVGKDSNQNAVTMVTTSNPNRNMRRNIVGSLQVGESVSKNGLKLTVISQNSEGYLVQLSQ